MIHKPFLLFVLFLFANGADAMEPGHARPRSYDFVEMSLFVTGIVKQDNQVVGLNFAYINATAEKKCSGKYFSECEQTPIYVKIQFRFKQPKALPELPRENAVLAAASFETASFGWNNVDFSSAVNKDSALNFKRESMLKLAENILKTAKSDETRITKDAVFETVSLKIDKKLLVPAVAVIYWWHSPNLDQEIDGRSFESFFPEMKVLRILQDGEKMIPVPKPVLSEDEPAPQKAPAAPTKK